MLLYRNDGGFTANVPPLAPEALQAVRAMRDKACGRGVSPLLGGAEGKALCNNKVL